MTPAEWIAYLINAIVACTALPMHETTLGGRTYQLQSWTCQFSRGPVIVRAFGAPFDMAIYRNRFGEFQIGEGAQVSDAYEGPCGS